MHEFYHVTLQGAVDAAPVKQNTGFASQASAHMAMVSSYADMTAYINAQCLSTQVSNVVLKTPQRKFEDADGGLGAPPGKLSPLRGRTAAAISITANASATNSPSTTPKGARPQWAGAE